MLKQFTKIICLLTMLLSFYAASVCSAGYSTYLNNDKNYILCDGHMGRGWYIVRDSLAVEKYEPPEYVIKVQMVSAESAIGNVDDFYNRQVDDDFLDDFLESIYEAENTFE